MRHIGMDVHRDFCEVAICDGGAIRSAPRIPTKPEQLLAFARELSPEDEVALENTGNARTIADIIRPHVAKVVVANAMAVKAIAHAKIKTDKLDAAMLARLLAAGMLPEVDLGDEVTRVARRRISRRAALIKQRTAAKNEIHAVLARRLKDRSPFTDLFGASGRRWLGLQTLPEDEADTVAGCLRQIDALSDEVALIDAAIARVVANDQGVHHLMTIPGVDITTAATLRAVIGNVKRFRTPKQLVSYLGLNPTVHQSGLSPGFHGRISKAGSSTARWVLTEAAWTATRTPGPLRVFAERVGGRRGKQIAAVAVARKLAVLSWHLLTKDTDYAFARPRLVQAKMRRLKRLAGDEPAGRQRTGLNSAAARAAEQAMLEQAETAYRRLISDRAAGVPKKRGAGATTGVRMS